MNWYHVTVIEDLILSVAGTNTVIRVQDEFLGELSDYYSDGVQGTAGVDEPLTAATANDNHATVRRAA